jgi:benzaldehyde dehydrogenase (NAD)
MFQNLKCRKKQNMAAFDLNLLRIFDAVWRHRNLSRAAMELELTQSTLSHALLSGVTPDNPAFNEEIFGPVAVVVPFDSDDEAIALANRTEYGLSMGVVTANVGRALRIGERLRTGLLHINDQTVSDDVVNPFGGVGASGNGESIGGPANWEEFTQWQWMTIKGEAPLYSL